MSSKNFYGLTGDVTIDGGILNVGNAQLYANTDTSNVGIGTTNPEFTLDVHGDANVGVLYSTFLHGDGSNIENIVSSQWEGLPGDPIYYTSNVGIANTVPVTVTLQIGSNVAIDDTGANVIEVYGNVNASYFIGDGSQLTGIAATLDDIVDQGNTVSNTIILESGADPVSNIGLVTKEGVCISVSNTNATGEFQFGVGSNLFVNVYSSNVLTVGGNVFAEKMTLGTVTIKPAYNLEQVTGQGNATSNTIQFTNATTGLVTTSNINVGGRLVFGANVFVDSLRTADLAANLVTYDATTGELLDSAGLISNKLAVVSEQPPTAIEASSEEGTVGNLFDKDIGTKWVSTATYSTTNDGTLGDYIGSADLTSTGPLGEWVKITLPYATILRHIKCESTNSSVEDLTIVGLGADGVTWTTLKSVTGLTGNTHAIVVDAIAEYKTYGFIIQVTNSTSGRSAVEIGELRLFTESFSIDGGYTTITQLRLGSTLEVSGNVEVGTANLFVDTVTGNVGIGKTNPGATLDIAGNMRLGDGLGNVVDFSIETTPTIGDPIWQAALLHPSPAVGDNFGHSVSISADGLYALVGVRSDDVTNAGSAQVYIRVGTSWVWQAQLLHPNPAANDFFGGSVSISADGLYALVGVAYDDTGGSNAGSAQVYVRTGTSWSHQAQLLHPNPAAGDEFGYSVSISADGLYALIGAYRDDTGGSNAGSAQVYVRTGTSWAWQTELVHPTPAAGDFFGYSVSISGDGVYALVGVHLDDTGATNTGSAQVYVGGPEMETELIVSTPIKADGTLLSFTGQHICFPEGRMSQGLVVSANQNKYMSLNGPVTMGLGAIKSSESLPVVSLSNVANDRSVFGVVDRFEGGGTERTQTIGIGKVSSAKEVGDNRVIVNSIGEGALWVANTNGNLVSGDYLTTSSLPGYAQKQDSDSLKNSTVAKITMACDFSPEDIPVQIIKKKENGDNDLDSYGRFQWVDTEKTQKAYKVRYLTSDGKGTDQSNAVHILAYVGCTYHCG